MSCCEIRKRLRDEGRSCSAIVGGWSKHAHIPCVIRTFSTSFYSFFQLTNHNDRNVDFRTYPGKANFLIFNKQNGPGSIGVKKLRYGWKLQHVIISVTFVVVRSGKIKFLFNNDNFIYHIRKFSRTKESHSNLLKLLHYCFVLLLFRNVKNVTINVTTCSNLEPRNSTNETPR